MSAIKFLAIVAASFALTFLVSWVGLGTFGGDTSAWGFFAVMGGAFLSLLASVCQMGHDR